MRHSECIIFENSSGCVVKRGRLSGAYVFLSHFLGEGIRDLSVDECYPGMGLNRCKYFVRYDHHHGEPYGADIPNSGILFTDIICKCPGSYLPFQLSLF